jgi:NADPH2:quinone reductase
MAKAIRIHNYGGPEVMSYEDVPTPTPKDGEVLIRQTAIGLNFIDVYHRTGLYPAASLPFTPGSEGAGEVIAVGAGVSAFKPGDRVAYGMSAGADADERVIPEKALVKVPDGIDDDPPAAQML